MGTETKFNCYSENTTTQKITTSTTTTTNGEIVISKTINGSSSGLTPHADSTKHSNGIVNGKSQATTTTTTPTANETLSTKASVSVVEPPTFVPIRIDEDNVVEGAKDILRVIRPHWDLNAVQFKKFTDGITNKLVGCFNTQTATQTNGNSSNGNSNGSSPTPHSNDTRNKGSSEDDIEETEEEEISANTPPEPTDNVVLVRVYGNKTDLLIDRKAERRNILLLHSYGFAPSLYATFKNGLAYDYVPGITLNTGNVLRPEVWRLVARRMAEMHRVVKVGSTPGEPEQQQQQASESHVPMLWKKTHSFMDLVPERFSNAEKRKRIEGTFLPISRMREEFASLYKRLETLDSPVVFAHNDLLLGNIVYMESQKTVNFIDYEYADYNFQAFDIGNHFCEFAGVDEVDFSRYPTRDFQLQWLRVYLQAYLRRAHITDAEVERLYVQVNQFALAAHLFWIIWSLIQAEHSTIDFDYVDYALMRYNEYLAKKEEFIALNTNEISSGSGSSS